jgi:hypothetical protein
MSFVAREKCDVCSEVVLRFHLDEVSKRKVEDVGIKITRTKILGRKMALAASALFLAIVSGGLVSCFLAGLSVVAKISGVRSTLMDRRHFEAQPETRQLQKLHLAAECNARECRNIGGA